MRRLTYHAINRYHHRPNRTLNYASINARGRRQFFRLLAILIIVIIASLLSLCSQ